MPALHSCLGTRIHSALWFCLSSAACEVAKKPRLLDAISSLGSVRRSPRSTANSPTALNRRKATRNCLCGTIASACEARQSFECHSRVALCSYSVSEWGACSHTCGVGSRSRAVNCKAPNGRVVLSSECSVRGALLRFIASLIRTSHWRLNPGVCRT